eukprot:Tbor_TRINITY_DN6170_c0_g3::TRINITY_DN6170_c0_g3_i1::g.22302::m.22302
MRNANLRVWGAALRVLPLKYQIMGCHSSSIGTINSKSFGSSSQSHVSVAGITQQQTPTYVLRGSVPPIGIIIREMPKAWSSEDVEAFLLDALEGEADQYVYTKSSRDIQKEADERYVEEDEPTVAEGSSSSQYTTNAIEYVRFKYSPKTGRTVRQAVVYFRNIAMTLSDYQNQNNRNTPHEDDYELMRRRSFEKAVRIQQSPQSKIIEKDYQRENDGHQLSSNAKLALQHPLIKKILSVNIKSVLPLAHTRGSSGREMSIELYDPDGFQAMKLQKGGSFLMQRERCLQEARNPRVVLETLDLDRYLMSPDLLYDFARMKQPKYMTRSSLVRKEHLAKKKRSKMGKSASDPLLDACDDAAITLNSFKGSLRDDHGEVLIEGDDMDEVGRGSPINNSVSKPYID